MDLSYLLAFIVTMALATFVTRALPFWIFRDQQHPVVLFLGRYLPPAVMTLLVMYCLKEVQWTSGNHGLPELLSLAIVVIAHLLFKNALISIFSGTALYMMWVQGALTNLF
jgi:branched-subunit amino acid transport protein AzlD